MYYETIVHYLSYVISALGFITTVVLAIISKSRGTKNKLYNILSYIAAFTRMANVYFGAKTGEAKKAWVLSKIQGLCAQYNVDYDESLFSDYIEYILSSDKKEVLNEKDESTSRQRQTNFWSHRKQD